MRPAIGRDVRDSAAVAAKVNEVIKSVSGQMGTFPDARDAGRQLASLLDGGPRRLLVLDDLWDLEQLEPFLIGGSQCARLVTTRSDKLLVGRGHSVLVDQMSPEQSRALLTADIPGLDRHVVDDLLAETGRWPLLLRMSNQIIADLAPTLGASEAGRLLVERLRDAGPGEADALVGDPSRPLDVANPDDRRRAVRATIDASRELLDEHERTRLSELAVIPFGACRESP